MTSAEYINELKQSLAGEVSPQVIQETVNYYGKYIIDEVNAGKTEEQVIEELGPARLIAKTIIDAKEGAARKQEAQQAEEQRRTERENRHFEAGLNEDGKLDIKYGKFSLNSWYGKLLLILAVILVLVILGAIVVGLFNLLWFLLPIIAVVALVLGLVWVFRQMGRK